MNEQLREHRIVLDKKSTAGLLKGTVLSNKPCHVKHFSQLLKITPT